MHFIKQLRFSLSFFPPYIFSSTKQKITNKKQIVKEKKKKNKEAFTWVENLRAEIETLKDWKIYYYFRQKLWPCSATSLVLSVFFLEKNILFFWK